MKNLSSTRATNGQESRSSKKPEHDQIAALAYQLYLENGCQEGREVQDWLRAEELLMQQPTREAATSSDETAYPQDVRAPHGIRPLGTRDYPFARDERGSASREQIRRQTTQVRAAARQSQRPAERAGQSR